jgi:drug/metabolite transporter (DMT)-like permease
MSLWHRHTWLAYAAVLTGVMGHASSEFVSVLTGLGGPETSVWRFTLGGAGLVAVALCLPHSRDLITPLRRHGARITGLAMLGVTLAYLAFHWSLDYATVPQVATLVTGIPIFAVLVAAVVDRTRLPGVKLATGALALLGVALLVTDGYLAELAGARRNLFGMALVLCCAASVGAYLILIRPVVAEYGALRATALTMVIGGAGLWLVVGLAWGSWVDLASLPAKPTDAVVAILVLALFNTTLTQFLWIGGLAATPDMTRSAYLFFLKPVIAAVLAVAFLAQELTVFQVCAAALICSTVLVELYWPRIVRQFLA